MQCDNPIAWNASWQWRVLFKLQSEQRAVEVGLGQVRLDRFLVLGNFRKTCLRIQVCFVMKGRKDLSSKRVRASCNNSRSEDADGGGMEGWANRPARMPRGFVDSSDITSETEAEAHTGVRLNLKLKLWPSWSLD